MAQRRKKRRHADSPWPDALRALRRRLGARDGRESVSQAELARRLGLPRRTVIAWENRQSVPSRPSAELLRRTFPDFDFPA